MKRSISDTFWILRKSHMVHRISKIILVLSLSLSCLTACSSAETDSPSTSPDEAEVQKTETTPAQNQTSDSDSSNDKTSDTPAESKEETPTKTESTAQQNKDQQEENLKKFKSLQYEGFSQDDIPLYDGDLVVEMHEGKPYFNADLPASSFEQYSPLDSLSRAGAACACIGKDLMPDSQRESISTVEPTGWKNRKYSFIGDDDYVYNRCHLIGFQLTGENANAENLITGTQYFNVDGMLPYENKVANFVKSTDAHVAYRVTPVYTGDNLVADGVLMEASSVEDQGQSLAFCVFVNNVQPGVAINYATGDNQADGTIAETKSESEPVIEQSDSAPTETETVPALTLTYVVNTNTKKFHYSSCPSVSTIKAKNRWDTQDSRDHLISMGYQPCKRCNP